MSDVFTINAVVRESAGKGASRRLRREGMVPAIIYGGAKNRKPTSLTIEARELVKVLQNEAVYSHVLNIQIGDKEEQAILMDVQRHPAKGHPLHVDFERVTKNSSIHKRIPLHFINEEKCKAVKLQGGKIQHNATDVEITCKVGDLPEFIEVDMANVELGQVVHLSDLALPKGITLVELNKGSDHDAPVVSITKPAGVSDDSAEGDVAATEE